MIKIRAAMPMSLMAAIGLALTARAQAPPERPERLEGNVEARAVTTAILEEIDKNSELMANLEYLCDVIGPRLTGSEGMARASAWTKAKFEGYGLENTHLEGFKIARAWTRGPATGQVVAPTRQRLILEAAGWSPSTSGAVRGPVVHLKGRAVADLDTYKGKLKGAWIVAGPVSIQPNPRVPEPEQSREGGSSYQFRRAIRDFAAKEGAAGILRDSNKEHGLINMTGASSDFTPAKLPEAFLTTESYGLIWRLLGRGPVELEVDIRGTFSEGEVEVHNTVAELKGTERPDEVVIVGGHLDSWDLGTGATDNGTGTMAVLEAARALKAVGVKPRRTIRFLMFNGEEQGLHGSKAYVKAHEGEMDKVSAVLVHDMGTGKVTSIGLQGRYDVREPLDGVVAPFRRSLKLDELSMRPMGGTDHLSFLPHGVPAFAVVQDEAEYRKTHHTESDTFDKVYPDEVNQGAKVLAAWAYNVAMLPDVLPRDPKRKRSEPESEAPKGDGSADPGPAAPKPEGPPAGSGS